MKPFLIFSVVAGLFAILFLTLRRRKSVRNTPPLLNHNAERSGIRSPTSAATEPTEIQDIADHLVGPQSSFETVADQDQQSIISPIEVEQFAEESPNDETPLSSGEDASLETIPNPTTNAPFHPDISEISTSQPDSWPESPSQSQEAVGNKSAVSGEEHFPTSSITIESATEGSGVGDSELEAMSSAEPQSKEVAQETERNFVVEAETLNEQSSDFTELIQEEVRNQSSDNYDQADESGAAPPTGETSSAIGSNNGEVQPFADAGIGFNPKFEPCEDSIDPEETTEIESSGPSQRPARYRPPAQRAPRARQKTPPAREITGSADISLRIRVRILFDKFGFCRIGLLPERSTGLDDEVVTKLHGAPISLTAQEDWYEDLLTEGLGDFLRYGLELKGRLADDRRIKWLLTGRDLYVLATHPRANGFVSTDRLVLGRSHVVLCTAESLGEVESVLAEAGCQGYTRIDETLGVPPNWVALRDVLPTRPIVLGTGSDPFYPIKPAPDIDIELTDGICLRNSVWLKGYPPKIHVVGQFDGSIKVRIDQSDAQLQSDGSFTADDHDKVGPHLVYCEGLSVSSSYSIQEQPESWEEWDAYVFGATSICGPQVRLEPGTTPELPFVVPMSNLLLLGAKPGQLVRCAPRRSRHWKGFLPFEVVWALPLEPLRCDKRVTRILSYKSIPVIAAEEAGKTVEWAKAILDASRKGLRFLDEDPEIAERWREYRKTARQIWKASR